MNVNVTVEANELGEMSARADDERGLLEPLKLRCGMVS